MPKRNEDVVGFHKVLNTERCRRALRAAVKAHNKAVVDCTTDYKVPLTLRSLQCRIVRALVEDKDETGTTAVQFRRWYCQGPASLADLSLISSFTFSETSEGSDFWWHIFNTLD